MNIHYKIVEIWPEDHLIVVRYWTDTVTEEYLNSDPHNENNRNPDGSIRRCRSDVSITLPTPTPTGKELEEIIMRNAPSFWLKTLEDVADPFVDTSMNELLSMRGKTYKGETEDPKYYPSPISDQEIDKLIESLQNKQ